jgi:hypothetical protein
MEYGCAPFDHRSRPATRRSVREGVPSKLMPRSGRVISATKTPVLEPAEARQLLHSIDAPPPAGLRDRALIALMVYSSARVGAALAWVRLREKGARRTPCHHNLEEYLAAYLDGAGSQAAVVSNTAPRAWQAAHAHGDASGQCARHDPRGERWRLRSAITASARPASPRI